MPSILAPLNLRTALVDKAGKATTYFSNIWLDMTGRIESAAFVDEGQSVGFTAHAAAILATALVVSASVPLYRITFALHIALAASISSSATVSVGWTQNAVPQTSTFAAVTGNTTGTNQSGSVLVRPDPGTVVTVAVAYASSGAPAMAFDADFIAEAVS